MNTPHKIRIVLADDHTMVRQGLRALLEVEKDIEVVGEAQTGTQAIELAKSLKPTMVIMDFAMPQLNGLQALKQIHKDNPRCNILVLSMYSDAEFAREVVREGAMGYLVKQSAAIELIQAVRAVARGNTFFSPSIAMHLTMALENQPNQIDHWKPAVNLTTREFEVLQLIAEGHPNKGIASLLGISVKTVDKHREHLMSKLNIHDVAGLTRYAISKGIIERTQREGA
jgi:DNA-binding NarL/FixJ family response regulator